MSLVRNGVSSVCFFAAGLSGGGSGVEFQGHTGARSKSYVAYTESGYAIGQVVDCLEGGED